jgi:hypothetical protein
MAVGDVIGLFGLCKRNMTAQQVWITEVMEIYREVESQDCMTMGRNKVKLLRIKESDED